MKYTLQDKGSVMKMHHLLEWQNHFLFEGLTLSGVGNLSALAHIPFTILIFSLSFS